MDEMEISNSSMEQKISTITQDIRSMKEMLLGIRLSLERGVNRDIQVDCLSKIKNSSDSQVNRFIATHPDECEHWWACKKLIDKATSKILRRFMEDGRQSALSEVEFHTNAAIKNIENASELRAQCCDNDCAGRVVNIFNTLRDLIASFNVQDIRLSHNPRSEIDAIEATEIAKLFKPLTNESRIHILRELAQGNKNFVTLEKITGLKAGALQFHLNKLSKARMITKDIYNHYAITNRGLKVFELSHELFSMIN